MQNIEPRTEQMVSAGGDWKAKIREMELGCAVAFEESARFWRRCAAEALVSGQVEKAALASFFAEERDAWAVAERRKADRIYTSSTN